MTNFPLSHAQEAFWFLQELNPESTLYNIPLAYEIRGPLDVRRIGRALDALRRRHEICRTRFLEKEGKLSQVIDPPADVELHPEAIAATDPDEVEAELAKRVFEESHKPFRLAKEWSLRARLVQATADRHLLLISLHHIISDAGSIGILLHDLSVFHAGDVLPPLGLQYVDYAAWNRKMLSGKAAADHIAFWKKKLTDLPRSPLAERRNSSATAEKSAGATRRRRLAASLAASTHRRSRANGVTPFCLMLTSLMVLRAKHCNQDDVAVLCPFANRENPQTTEMIGPLLTLVAVRADLSGNPTLEEAARRVSEAVFEAFAHKDIPLDLVVRAIGTSGDLSQFPITPVGFNFAVGGEPQLTLAGLDVTPVPIERDVARLPLTLFVRLDYETLDAGIEYDPSRFDAAEIDSLLAGFEECVAGVVQNPQSSRMS